MHREKEVAEKVIAREIAEEVAMEVLPTEEVVVAETAEEFNAENGLIPQVKNERPKKLVVYLPNNLNLGKLLKEEPPKEMPLRNIDHVKDNMAQILHVISYLPSVKKDFDYEGNKGFIPLNRQKLQKSGIHDYNVYLDYLVEKGIILANSRYVKGTLSKGIKFSEQYAFSKIKKSFITKKTLVKAANKKTAEANLQIQQQYPYLYKSWISGKLSFDHRAALRDLENKLNNDKAAFLEKHNMTEIEYYEEQLKMDSASREKVKYPTKQYNSNYLLMDRLQRQEYFWKIDKKAGRLHTILTQMSKDFRKFVSYDGQKLVGIDLRNSQPLLATALLDKNIFNNNPIIMNKIREHNPYHCPPPHPLLC